MKNMTMKLFGRFMLEGDNGVVLKEEELRSGKLMKVLCYLLMHRDQAVTQQALIETILEEDTKNPENTIRNLMYRLRNELRVFGEDEFVRTIPGAYRWNPEIRVDTDYERLERLAREIGENSKSSEAGHGDWCEKQKELCEAVIECYDGNVTRKLAGEVWLLPQVVHFRTVYFDVVKQLCAVCELEKDWKRIERICRRALEEDHYDEELHCWLIRSLYRRDHVDQAVQQYEKAKKLFYENLGVSRMEKLQQVYQEILTDRDNAKMDIDTLMQSMKDDPQKPNTGILCDFQIFRELYRIEMKRIQRLGIAEYVLMLGLRRTSRLWDQSMTDPALLKLMDELEQVVSDSLRTSDVATRFNAFQILAMLPGCSFEGGMAVVNRIRTAFAPHIGKRQIELVYDLKEISDTRSREARLADAMLSGSVSERMDKSEEGGTE